MSLSNRSRTKDRYRNNTPVYPSSILDLTLPGRYIGLVIHCRAPLSSASGFETNAFLHLWSFTIPTSPRSGQGSSSSNTMLLTLSPTFNFFINVGMVWCWWVTHGMSTYMRFGPLMYDFDIRRCDVVEEDGECLCEWKCFLCWYSCTIGFIRIVLVTVSESCRRVFK